MADESIYSWIKEEVPEREREARYKSKFDPTAPVSTTLRVVKKPAGTMGRKVRHCSSRFVGPSCLQLAVAVVAARGVVVKWCRGAQRASRLVILCQLRGCSSVCSATCRDQMAPCDAVVCTVR